MIKDIQKGAGFLVLAGEEFGGRACKYHAALAEQRDSCGQFHCFPNVVGNEDGGLAKVRAEPQEFTLEIEAGDRVEGAEGLVEKEYARIGCEGAGDTDALALAARELTGEASREVRSRKADAQEQFLHDFVAAWTKVMNLDRFDLR